MDLLANIRQLFATLFSKGYIAPNQEDRLRAIGATDELPGALRSALYPDSDFEPMPIPEVGDWLDHNRESGQTFDEFMSQTWQRPDTIRNKIYILPLGALPDHASPSLEILTEYVNAFFRLSVESLAPILSLNDYRLTARHNPHTQKSQLLTGDIQKLLGEMLPADGFCILGVTVADLYPDSSANFVFGLSDLGGSVGIQSFARYDPAFFGNERLNGYEKILLERSCKVVVHEIAHMFGLQHCIFFKCILNGFNNLKELDAAPFDLCPVCLRKLQFSIGFDVVERYRHLLPFYRMLGFDVETQWVANRLRKISNSEKTKSHGY